MYTFRNERPYTCREKSTLFRLFVTDIVSLIVRFSTFPAASHTIIVVMYTAVAQPEFFNGERTPPKRTTLIVIVAHQALQFFSWT